MGAAQVGRAATGYTIAREMPMPEGPGGAAPRLLKEALFRLDRDFRDGTARLALIAGACFSAGVREVRRHPARQLSEALAGLSREIEHLLDDERISRVDLQCIGRSAGLDAAFGHDLAGLVAQVGCDAVIDIKENDRRGVEIVKAQGFVFDAKSIGEGALPSLSRVSVLVADEVIQDFGTLASVLEGFAGKHRALVIAARDITGSALATLKRNQKADIVTVAALQPSDTGERAAGCLEDLAAATGATIIAERFGLRIESLRPAMLGRAAEFTFANGRAAFLRPEGREEDIAFRMSILRASAEKARHLSFDQTHFDRRRGRLGNRWSELRLAAATPYETQTLIATATAAVNAMQSSLRDGAVSGGGAVFARLATRLQQKSGTEIDAAARRVLARGLGVISSQLAFNNGPVPMPASEIQDPALLTNIVINQAIGLCASLLRTGAIVTR
ncbi:N/A [soil metagenome]